MATSKIKKPTTAYLLQGDIVIQEFTKNYDIGANASIEIDFNIAKNGYTPFGIVGVNSGGQVFCVSCARAGYNSTTAVVTIKNTVNTAYSGRTVRIDVLYIKNKS